MVDVQRAAKMADRIKEIVAQRLEKGVRDPRMGFVTITDVKMTGDLQHASIFYTVYGTDEERAETAAALKSATGMLRTEVGKNLTARLTPSIEFIADGIPENAALISSLLDEAARARRRGRGAQEDRAVRGRRRPVREAAGHSTKTRTSSTRDRPSAEVSSSRSVYTVHMGRIIVEQLVSADGFGVDSNGGMSFMTDPAPVTSIGGSSRCSSVSTPSCSGRVTYGMFAGYWPDGRPRRRPGCDPDRPHARSTSSRNTLAERSVG